MLRFIREGVLFFVQFADQSRVLFALTAFPPPFFRRLEKIEKPKKEIPPLPFANSEDFENVEFAGKLFIPTFWLPLKNSRL